MSRPLLFFFSVLIPVTIASAAGCRDCANRSDGRSDGAAAASSASSSSLGAAPSSSSSVDVVSSASPHAQGGSADGGDPVVVTAAGQVDGKALRALHHARISADTSAVTLLQGGTARELGAKLCAAVVPSRPKELPILIKPNMGGFEFFKDPATHSGDDGVRGRTTDPEFVRGIVQCLKSRGHTKITIAEGWAHTHAIWQRLIRVSGYEKMAHDEGVALVAMDDDGVFDVEGEQPGKPLRVTGMESTGVPTILMPKLLAEHLQHGMFISAPKIKAHRFGVVSMAIKGMQGTVMLSDASPAFHQKWRTHKELPAALKLLASAETKEAGQKAYLDSLHIFAERMTDLLEIEAPDVVLAEGAPAMGGDGFAKRWPSAEDVAIGGTNPILVDRIGAAVLGLWDNAELARQLGGHKTSPLIESAAKRFRVDITSPKVEGNGKELLDPSHTPARPVHFVSMSGFSIHSDNRPAEIAPRGAIASDGGADDGVATGAKPEARAHRVEDDAITVDGEIEDIWRKAAPVSFTTDWSGADAGTKTSARFAWTKHALYILWELEGAGVNSDASRPPDVERARLYEEDCVELFFTPDPAERKRYFEVEIGPLGHFLDISVDRIGKKNDVAWSSKPRIATKVNRDAHKVTIEVELRATEIASALKSGAILPMALYRMEGRTGGRKYLAWSPTRTPKPDFHVPDAFGTLKLE